MLAGILLTFALCFDACAIDQEVQQTSSPAIWQAYVQRSLTMPKGTEIWHRPIKPDKLQQALHKTCALSQWQSEQHFKVRQAWSAASLKFCCRPRLSLGGGTQSISGSNQIDSEPRRFKLSLYDDQFVVLYLIGDQLFITPSYHIGFMS